MKTVKEILKELQSSYNTYARFMSNEDRLALKDSIKKAVQRAKELNALNDVVESSPKPTKSATMSAPPPPKLNIDDLGLSNEDLERLRANKKSDSDGYLDDVDIDDVYLPILLRDAEGQLLFAEIGTVKYDLEYKRAKKLEDANNIKFLVPTDVYTHVALFTIKGNPNYSEKEVISTYICV